MSEKELREKAERKCEMLDLRLKKFNDLIAENKRKQKIM